MISIPVQIILVASLVLFVAWKVILSPKKNTLPLPPGPKGKPIIGNLLDLPAAGQKEWTHWLKHKDLYGPLSSITVFGQTLIIINDRQLAIELLDKHSAKHSSRPNMTFANELCGWGKAPSNQDNTSLLRAYRRAMARVIGTRASASKFDHSLEIEARRFLWRVLQRPQSFADHIRVAAGSFVLKLAYGYNVEPHGQDPLVNLAELALNQFSKAVMPGAWLVDMLPALQYLPDWFPGTEFKRIARTYQETLTKFLEIPFAFSRYKMAQNEHQPSLVSNLLEQGEDEDIVKWAALALYGAGADTTVSALKGFFLAMTLYPDVQRKAQAEIDRVFGQPTLPTVADRTKLPYIDAVVKETLRWHTVTPLGLPHKADEEDVINNLLIPKGALLLPNIWAYNHDPEVYSNPFEFKPERFLPSTGSDPAPDPHNVSFGFGRRVCPGRLVADTSMFLTIAQSLAVFDMTKPRSEDNKEVNPQVDFTPGIISHPTAYGCIFTARSPKHRDLIQEVERDHPFENGDATFLAETLSSV